MSDLLSRSDPAAALAAALARGGEFADIFAEEKTSTLIEVDSEQVDKLVQGKRAGAGVRVVHDFRTAYSYTDDLAASALAECAAVASAAVKDGGAREPIALRSPVAHQLPIGREPSSLSVRERIDLLFSADRAARSVDRRVKQVRLVYADTLRRIAVANSAGVYVTDLAQYLVLYVEVVAADENGLQVAHEAWGGARGLEVFDERSPEEVAVLAARRAVRNLTAASAPAGTMTVVLAAEAGGTMVHEAVGHGLEADLAEQGLSVYADRLGERIASPLVTVLDDATVPGRRGSFSVDDEGTAAQRTVLVDRGVLKGYMFDLRLGMKKGMPSTGNGRRESYGHPPIVRMTNTMIAPGESAPEEILRSVDRGLYVRRMGGGEVNTVNGDFVFEVEDGCLIERGELGPAVRGATLTGNGPRVLMEIDMVGSDLDFGMGTCGKDGQGVPVSDAQPTLRIPEIVVGGRV